MGINEKAWHVGFKWTIGNEDVPTGALAIDNTSKQLHICDIADVGKDWNVAVVVDPTLYIHCYDTNAATDYIKIWHDDTDANIDCYGATALNLGLAGTNYLELSTSALYPTSAAGIDLGTSALGFNDLHLDSGGVINFDGGDVTITHSANALAFAGVTGGYSFDDTITSTDTTGGFVASGAATDGVKVTGACTDGIEVSGECTYALNVSASQTAAFYYVCNQTASEGAWVHGLKVETTRTADAVIASGGYYGAQIVVNKGSDSYTNGMAPNTFGCQVVIKGANTKNNTYGLAVETQSSGYVDYLCRFLLNSGTTLAAAGAMLYLQTYVNTNIGLKIGAPATSLAMTTGISFEDNAGTDGAITSLIGFNTRNSTNLFKCDYAAGCVAANTHSIDGHALQHILVVDIEGDTGYIPVLAGIPA